MLGIFFLPEANGNNAVIFSPKWENGEISTELCTCLLLTLKILILVKRSQSISDKNFKETDLLINAVAIQTSINTFRETLLMVHKIAIKFQTIISIKVSYTK